MNNRTEMAVSKFSEGYNCAQSVLYSFCDDIHLDKNTALKMACGFGAGMGRKEEVCGAVTGGIIVIGAKYGRGEGDADGRQGIYLRQDERTHGPLREEAWHLHLPQITPWL